MSELDLDLGRLVRLSTDDFSHTMNIGVYRGRASFTVFDNNVKGQGPVIKYLFTETSLCILKELLEKIISDDNMKPIEMSSHPYNRDTRQKEFRSSLSIGRDDKKSIYFEMVGEKHKAPLRFKLITDVSTHINGKEIPKKMATEFGAKTVIRAINDLISTGCVITNTRNPNGYQAPDPTATPSSMGSDVPLDTKDGDIPF